MNIKIQKYSVGDCEMIESKNGSYMRIAEFAALLHWLEEDDDRDVVMAKIEELRAAI